MRAAVHGYDGFLGSRPCVDNRRLRARLMQYYVTPIRAAAPAPTPSDNAGPYPSVRRTLAIGTAVLRRTDAGRIR